jgi:hypothetical protein
MYRDKMMQVRMETTIDSLVAVAVVELVAVAVVELVAVAVVELVAGSAILD